MKDRDEQSMSGNKKRGDSIHTTFNSWNYITFEIYLQTNLQRSDLITKKADVDLICMWLFIFYQEMKVFPNVMSE